MNTSVALPFRSIPMRSISMDGSLWLSVLQILGASFLIALAAQIQIPLFFSPVPLSGQTLAVMFIGATLGSRKGGLSVLAYILEGTSGLPVFAGAGFGPMALLGPTGGYLVGFILQAYFVGFCVESQRIFSAFRTIAFLMLTSLLQLGLGVLWLTQFVGFESAIAMGFVPFIFGESLKVLGMTKFLQSRKSV